MKRIATLLIAVTLTGCVGSAFRPNRRGQETRATHRASCQQALKDGWCGPAYKECRHKPDSCKPRPGINVGGGSSVGLTGGGVGRR